MPLRAVIAGTSAYAFQFTPNDWHLLQGELREDRSLGHLPCCDSPAVAKTSQRGTQFFAHYAKSACGASRETEAHRAAKRAVYEGCIDAGWSALTEAVGPDGAWRADVLASRQRTQVAFEIQWSRQSAERTTERHHDFARHQVRCFWLFRRLPFAKPNGQVPAFQLIESPGGGLPSVMVGSRTGSLQEFAHWTLDGRVKFCTKVSVRLEEVRCRIRRDRCPRCAGTVGFADATPPPLLSVCGLPLSKAKEFVATQRLYADWGRALESLCAEDLQLGANERETMPQLVLRSPPGKPFVTAAGRSGFCPSCLTVVPFTEKSSQLPIVFETRAPIRAPDWPQSRFPHWCVGNSGSYCSVG
jgi:hypothetical protein